MAKISIIVASAIMLFLGIIHLYETFFSTILHPADPDLALKLKSSHIQMHVSGNLWKMWLGFNAIFGACLIFIGSINLYLSARHFRFLTDHYFILLLTIVANAFFVWVGFRFMILGFAVSMAFLLLLYVTGFILIRVRPHPS